MESDYRGAVEKALGRILLDYWSTVSAQQVQHIADLEAANALLRIQAAANDPALDDFCCLDAIVDILNKAGYPTARHDF